MERVNITEFLLARIAEDEAVATDCLAVPFGYSWRTISWLHGANREHGKRHSPTRVLAVCSSVRAVVTEHKLVPQTYATSKKWDGPDVGCAICAEWDGLICPEGPCDTLRYLAAVYADHPDYDQAWRV